MLLMFEGEIRGGITQVVNQYAKANNAYMADKFNPREASSFFKYLDANNPNGWAMSQLLPTSGFRWVSTDPNDISRLAKHKDKGYLLEIKKQTIIYST